MGAFLIPSRIVPRPSRTAQDGREVQEEGERADGPGAVLLGGILGTCVPGPLGPLSLHRGRSPDTTEVLG